MIVRIVTAAAALGISACATAEQPIPVRGETPGRTCDNSNIRQFVGRQASSGLGAEMLRASGAAVLRWVPHGGVVTMDFRSDRLTVQLDASNRVAQVSCS